MYNSINPYSEFDRNFKCSMGTIVASIFGFAISVMEIPLVANITINQTIKNVLYYQASSTAAFSITVLVLAQINQLLHVSSPYQTTQPISKKSLKVLATTAATLNLITLVALTRFLINPPSIDSSSKILLSNLFTGIITSNTTSIVGIILYWKRHHNAQLFQDIRKSLTLNISKAYPPHVSNIY